MCPNWHLHTFKRGLTPLGTALDILPKRVKAHLFENEKFPRLHRNRYLSLGKIRRNTEANVPFNPRVYLENALLCKLGQLHHDTNSPHKLLKELKVCEDRCQSECPLVQRMNRQLRFLELCREYPGIIEC